MAKCRKCGNQTTAHKGICYVCMDKWLKQRIIIWEDVKTTIGEPTKENLQQIKDAVRKRERREKIKVLPHKT